MFWVATLPGLLLIVGMQYAVESPRWLGNVSFGGIFEFRPGIVF